MANIQWQMVRWKKQLGPVFTVWKPHPLSSLLTPRSQVSSLPWILTDSQGVCLKRRDVRRQTFLVLVLVRGQSQSGINFQRQRHLQGATALRPPHFEGPRLRHTNLGGSPSLSCGYRAESANELSRCPRTRRPGDGSGSSLHGESIPCLIVQPGIGGQCDLSAGIWIDTSRQRQ